MITMAIVVVLAKKSGEFHNHKAEPHDADARSDPC